MTSLRHNESPAESAADGYLDAARACILDVGWRRTTLTEVARRAGVSRMTIYRTWADMPTLLSDLMTREWGRVVSAQVAPREGAGASEQVVEGVVGAVRALREDELFVRIVEIDPELVLPYLFARRGRSQDLLLDLLVPVLEAGQRAGEVRQAPAVVVARALLLAVHGFVLSLHTMVDDRVDEAALLDELGHVVRAALRP